MRNYFKGIVFSLLLLPIISNAQSISSNLQYINNQFSLYNGHSTSFEIDNTELVCEDKYRILKANWEDIEIKIIDNNIGIVCLSEASCIRCYDKKGKREHGKNFQKYRMELHEHNKLIKHINEVVNKFAEIKMLIVNKKHGKNIINIKSKTETEIKKINSVLKLSSKYKHTYYIDYKKNAIISKTESCEAIIPVKSGLSIHYFQRDSGKYTHGFYFENSDNSILESCSFFENYTESTYEYVSNYTDAQTIILSLKKIINFLEEPATQRKTINSRLCYINKEFKKYNDSSIVWNIDYDTKQLIWKNDFNTYRIDLSDLKIVINYSDNVICIYCTANNKCVLKDNSDVVTHYKQYEMTLNDGEKMIPHIKDIVNEFIAIKEEIMENNYQNSSKEKIDKSDE